MTFGLTTTFICAYTIFGVFGKPNFHLPCPPIQSPAIATVTLHAGGRSALITCINNEREWAFCRKGSWTPSHFCMNNSNQDGNKADLGLQKLAENLSTGDNDSPRSKRNTGKYHDLRRRVKVQRKIKAGLLETTIDTSTPTIFRAHLFGTVHLACRVENLGAHSVTWIRRQDNNVMAIDNFLLTRDTRLTATHEEKTQTWLLGIYGARRSDEGEYECRVSTKPPIARIVTLQIFPTDQPLHGPVNADGHNLDFVLKNVTALWEEISNLREEINHHVHEGHTEKHHDKIMEEVETLHHEHHVHHLHHPHEGHNDHHSDELLRHLEEVHGHKDDHSDGSAVHGHLHGHGHSHDHVHGEDGDDESGEDDSHEEGEDGDHVHDHEAEHGPHHEHEDEHDEHGLHEHEDEHEYAHEHGHEHGHEHHDHAHDHHDHAHDHHDHAHDHAHDHHDHAHDHHDHAHDHHDHEHDDHDHAHDHDSDHHDHTATDGDHKEDPWRHAYCTIEPNADMPESNVKGSVVISQRKDGKGPVYFDINLSGVDVANTGSTHGFHVHEKEVTEGSCGSTGSHFNPDGVTHGGPGDDIRHVGDLGNVEVDENGELHGYIVADKKVSFDGPNSILEKAIVVHSGTDDLGQGGDEGSLATGNAGGRVACCTIHYTPESDQPMVGFRFKG